MPSPYLKFVLIPVSIFVLAACDTFDGNYDQSNPVPVGRRWSVNDVSYNCSDASQCPDHQGVLLAKKTTWFRQELYRCTATLYGPTRGVTAGHCIRDLITADQAWFVTVAKPGRPSRIYNVSRSPVAYNNPTDLWAADYGAFELTEAVTDVSVFAEPARQAPSQADMMVALVTNNASSDFRTFVLNPVYCRQSGSNQILPLAYSDHPSLFLVQNCKLYSGNSGGIVTPPGDLTHVLGIVATSSNADGVNDSDLAKILDRIGVSVPRSDWAGVTNARCLSFSGWPRTEFGCREINTPILRQMNIARALGNGNRSAMNP